VISYTSPSLQRLTGLRANSLLDRPLTDLVPAHGQAIVKHYWREIREGRPSTFSAEVVANGGRHIPVRISLLALPGTDEYLVIVHDTSQIERLEKDLRENASRLGILSRVAAAVSTTVDLDDLLRVLYEETAAVMEADAFFVALYDHEAGELEYRLQIDQGKQEPPSRWPVGHGLTSRVVESKRPLLIRNLPREALDPAPGGLWGSMSLPGSLLAVPMLIGAQLVGVISVQSYRTEAYDQTDLALLTTIAAQVAVVVQNVRLLTNERRRTGLLADIARLGAQLAGRKPGLHRVAAP
jgi:PAS domain S-box-containing protein